MSVSPDDIERVIDNRMNFKIVKDEDGEDRIEYDGFDMSGYNNCFYGNLELLARFDDLMNLDSYIKEHKYYDNRDRERVFPVFWKGAGKIISVDVEGKTKIIDDDISGMTSKDIIIEILREVNPKLFYRGQDD